MKKIIATAMSAILLSACGQQQSAQPQKTGSAGEPEKQRPTEVRFAKGAPQLNYIKVETVEAHPEPLIDPLTARVVYDENYTARISSPIAGRVIKINAQPGDQIKAGTPLAEIDAPEFAQAISDTGKSAADLTQKSRAYTRAKELVEAGVLPKKDLDAAESDLKQATAEHARATGRLNNYSGGHPSGNNFSLRSPISGVVAERKLNPGTEVRSDLQDPLFVVTDPTHLWVMVDLPERQLGAMRKGQKVNVEVDAYPNQQFPATVTNIGEVVDPATRRVLVRCTVENPRRLLRPEMYARVTPLADGPSKLPRVPNAALITEGLYTYLFIEIEPGVYGKRRVTPGLQGRTETYIKDGLKEGERAVTSGALLLNSELLGG